MILGNATPKNTAVEEMIAAEDRASAIEDTPPHIQTCQSGLKKEEEKEEEKKPKKFRVLMWNITELGGGFWMPSHRPDYCINGYARVINAIKPDIFILLGLRKGPLFTYGQVSSKKYGYCWKAETSTEDSGIMEAEAILFELRKLDSGSGWEVAFPINEDGSCAYVHGGTACIFYATGHEITLNRLDIVDGPAADSLGIPGLLIAARLSMPILPTSPATEVGIVAPFISLREDEHKSAHPLPKTTGEFPDSCVMAFSTELDLGANLSSLDNYRSGLDVQYQSLLDQGSILTIADWESIAYRGAGLIENLLAVHPSDVRLGDKKMHWEALTLPKHADEYGHIIGKLSDLLFLRSQAGQPLVLDKMRIVDLFRAAFASGELKKLRADEKFKEEDGVLIDSREKHIIATARSTTKNADDDPANLVAGCIEFLRLLSNHWPVYAELSAKS